MQQIAKRRAALASAHLEAGQGFWLAKQRWLWRRGRLSREQFLMLQLAGLEMDIDPPSQWKSLAHEAAHYLHGSQIQSDQVLTSPPLCLSSPPPPGPPTACAATHRECRGHIMVSEVTCTVQVDDCQHHVSTLIMKVFACLQQLVASLSWPHLLRFGEFSITVVLVSIMVSHRCYNG